MKRAIDRYNPSTKERRNKRPKIYVEEAEKRQIKFLKKDWGFSSEAQVIQQSLKYLPSKPRRDSTNVNTARVEEVDVEGDPDPHGAMQYARSSYAVDESPANNASDTLFMDRLLIRHIQHHGNISDERLPIVLSLAGMRGVPIAQFEQAITGVVQVLLLFQYVLKLIVGDHNANS